MRSIKVRNTSKRQKSTAKASESNLLSRLIGTETEYAFRYLLPERRNSQALYRLFVASFSSRLPVAESTRNPNRTFLANGGAVSWEPNMNTLLGCRGFVEVATPQCRSPKQVVAYQTAFDHLIADALEDPLVNSQDFVPAAAIRNSCDGYGQRYGQQENYEVEIARGMWLLLWRIGLVMLFPVLVAHKAFSRLVLVATLAIPAHARFSLLSRGKSETDEIEDINRLLESSDDTRRLKLATWLLQICHAPLEFLFQKLCCCVLLRKHRKVLGPFLASRVVLDGSGHVDKLGVFRVSCRGMQMNSFIGFSGNGLRKPMIDLHHWFRSLCLDDSRSFQVYRKLFRRHQRVQICCGDTSTNEFARWLQIGSTCLMLDLIENNANVDLPFFKQSSDELIQRFSKDAELSLTVQDRSGKKWNALAIQEHLVKCIRKYFMTCVRVPLEAWELLNAWQLMISRLQRRNADTQDAEWLTARCDWFTKKILLRRLPSNASYTTQKKIDIRYHEVGVESYYQRIAKFKDVPPLIDQALLDRATRIPPENTPATHRGYMIREFANSDQRLDIDWDRTRLAR